MKDIPFNPLIIRRLRLLIPGTAPRAGGSMGKERVKRKDILLSIYCFSISSTEGKCRRATDRRRIAAGDIRRFKKHYLVWRKALLAF